MLKVNAVDVNAARLDLFIGRLGRRLGDNVDFDAAFNELLGKVVDVRANPTHDAWGIFPR
jgi:hypothetical protein